MTTTGTNPISTEGLPVRGSTREEAMAWPKPERGCGKTMTGLQIALETMRCTISESALFSRINRRLEKEDQALRMTAHSSRWFTDTGRFYIVDLHTNFIITSHVDLQQLGRELGVLKANEILQEER